MSLSYVYIEGLVLWHYIKTTPKKFMRTSREMTFDPFAKIGFSLRILCVWD